MHYAIHAITQMQDSFLSFTRWMPYMINRKIILSATKMNYAK